MMDSDMEEEEFLGFPQTSSSKRMLSTEDPDYTRPPSPKRMKEMEERAHDELRERVIKVVDSVLCKAISEKQTELEEVDTRILRIQQCLHTLRYCISLNYHAASKLTSKGRTSAKQSYESHPAIRKHMGKAPIIHAIPSTSKLSVSTFEEKDMSSQMQCGRLSDEGTPVDKARNKESPVKSIEPNNPSKTILAEASDLKSKIQTTSKRRHDNGENSEENLKLSKPPSPKYLPPKPPDTYTIAQGRHQRFQAKRRIVVGNTYQYLTPQAGREAEDAMLYKWQVYIRAPPQETDIAKFVSGVTFILDKSYAPHDVITLTQPPFVLCRRGWGEFKVQIVLNFHDGRNKKVQLLHPLILSRPDDPLALTGLWRLGKENWYDIWVYEGTSSQTTGLAAASAVKGEESPASLERELLCGTVSSQVKENITVQHNESVKATSSNILENKGESFSVGNIRVQKEVSNINCGRNVCKPSSALIKFTINDGKCAQSKNDSKLQLVHSDEINHTKSVPHTSGVSTFTQSNNSKGKLLVSSANVTNNTNISNNGAQSKMCKIHVRQPDGRLVPYFIPANMYSVALKIAQTRSTNSKKEKSTDCDSA